MANEVAPNANEPVDTSTMEQLAPGAWRNAEQQLVVSDALLVDRWFAHRITEHELVAGWLTVSPDLLALATFAYHYSLANDVEDEAETVHVAGYDPDYPVPAGAGAPVLVGPDGWLDEGTADGVVLVGVRGRRLDLRWRAAQEPADGAPFEAAVAATFDRLLAELGAVRLLDLQLHLLVDHAALFDGTQCPLSEALEAADLAVHDAMVVQAADLATQQDPSVAMPGMGADAIAATEMLLRALLAPPATAQDVELYLPSLANADAVAAVSEQVIGGGLVGQDQFRGFLEAFGEPEDRRARAGLELLGSRLAEWQGDPEAQEAALNRSLAASEMAPALYDAAGFAADRGDSRRAVTLLRAARVPADDPEMRTLRTYTTAGPLRTGRNDACPCGSGRKYKFCCIRLNGHGLDARARWLHTKAVTFLQRPPQRADLLAVATAYAGVEDAAEAPDRVVAAACDPMISDVCLFDRGVLDRFIAQRGALLPDDELELARSWTGARTRLWAVTRGGGVTLRDVLSDREVRLDAASAQQIPDAQHVLAVVVDGPVAVPGIALAVGDDDVEALQAAIDGDADAAALAHLLGQRLGWTAAPEPAPATRSARTPATTRG